MAIRRHRTVLAALAATALTAGLAAPSALADAEIVFPNFCASAAPDATKTLGPNLASVQASSQGGTYGDKLCPRFVVHIGVPPNTSGGPGYEPSFTIGATYAGAVTGPLEGFDNDPLPLSQTDCAKFSQSLTIYRKALFDTDWVRVAGGTYTAQWIPGSSGGGGFPISAPCHRVASASFDQLPIQGAPIAPFA